MKDKTNQTSQGGSMDIENKAEKGLDFNDPSWKGEVWSCGRASGKGFKGVHRFLEYVKSNPNSVVVVMAPTLGMALDMCTSGSASIIRMSKDDDTPKISYNLDRDLYYITFNNGTICHILYSRNLDKIDPNSIDYAWLDEVDFYEDRNDTQTVTKLLLKRDEGKYIATGTPCKRVVWSTLNSLYIDSLSSNTIIFKNLSTLDNPLLPESYINFVSKLSNYDSVYDYNQEILGLTENQVGGQYGN
tara:strand:+ start:1355 stop:2086 length:732 start_codon:yes stop_codon:yes gene_type:complete